jgi:predicted transcriptional regulator of viral defense system
MKNIGTMRKPKWIIANNGGITFTYREEWESYRISEYKFEKAIANLIKAGLLDLVQPGRYRQPALYALSEHWKKCGTEDFVRQSVTKQSHRGGFQKGNKLGRNSTLQERTAYLQQQRQQKIEPIESKIEALKTEQQLSIEHKTSSRIPAIVDARIDYYSELLNKTKGI